MPLGAALRVTVLLCILLTPALLSAAPGEVRIAQPASPQPALRSRAAALYDAGTETLLYSRNGAELIPPASMTKLVTLHLVYEAIESGELSRDTELVVDEASDFRTLPPHSSLMFLQQGQRVTVLELMKGLAVPSGNDAALFLARHLGGSVDAFVEQMNREMERMGLEHTRFVDPNGLSAENRTTAVEFARFCLAYVKAHPRALEELHDLYRFTYPKPHNIPEGQSSVYGPITQYNHNRLAWGHPWVDGLKTGYIPEAGYNVAVTGEHEGRRLVGVLMGGPGENSEEGTLTRAIDGANLLSYGFYGFTRVRPAADPPRRELRVWKGNQRRVKLKMPRMEALSVATGMAERVAVELQLQEPLIAPVTAGEQVGAAVVRVAGRERARYPVTAAESIGRGSWLRRVWDGVLLGLR
jgi:D-alanyl-D-alanine carboxypeptidase (penicillin-binding protein 5/6)